MINDLLEKIRMMRNERYENKSIKREKINMEKLVARIHLN